MRWPLRFQIMLPMAIVLLTTVTTTSLINAYSAAQRTSSVVRQRLQAVAKTLATSSIPLTDGVLKQMKGLVGAEFILVDSTGQVLATTRPRWRGVANQDEVVTADSTLKFVSAVEIEAASYQHAVMSIKPTTNVGLPQTLHLYYPQSAYRSQWRQAVQTPLMTGGLALVVMSLLAMWIAARVSHPLHQLQAQVKRISGGEFELIELPRRNDEVKDLAISVNHMAHLLADYEDEVRRNERLRTLDQVGSGLAHQLRNLATGARIAVDIHRLECTVSKGQESLDVADRQLVLLEKYLQKFLTLGQTDPSTLRRLDFRALVEKLLPLVGPAAQHVDVAMQVDLPEEALWITGDNDGLEHVVLNLLQNAIDAAGAEQAAAARRHVQVTLQRMDEGMLQLRIANTGPEPPEAIRERIFEPLVSGKPEGAGLGLAIAREVVEKHQGRLMYEPRDGLTEFSAHLPLSPEQHSVHAETSEEAGCGKTVDC